MQQPKLNKIFQLTQATQLVLLSAQGVAIISSRTNKFYLPIWILLGVASAVQLILIKFYPAKIETKTIIDRTAMLKLRLLAILPYALIITGLLLSR